tara:strand:- start:58836 stop:59201 length:366 start_codon:yes stop_codon:yes gene_type:complete
MKFIISIFMILLSTQSYAGELESKSDLKAHYAQIAQKAKLLKSVPDDELVGEILIDCMKARKYDPNIFCLESVTEFFRYFPQTVERVSLKNFSKEESDFILKRLNVLNGEAILGNDPSSEP